MDKRQTSHEPMDILEEYVDVSREMEYNPLMTPLKEYEDREREWKEEKTIFEMRLKAESQKFKQMEDALTRAMETLEQKNRENVDQLTNENQLLKHLLSNLHKYVTILPELDDSAFEQSSSLKPDQPESNLYRQAQDIYNKLKEIKEIERHLRELENENQILKKLLRDLHMCATSKSEINNSPFELSDTVNSNQFVESAYHNAQDIYTQLKQTKEIERECEILHHRLNEVNETVLKSESDMIVLNNAWRETYLNLQQEKERELHEITTKWFDHCKELDEHYSQEKEQLLHSVEILKSEKDELLTRLSKIAADRLVHGNVDIADLSDPDRPTKIQEVYSELYDNEWTDAFEELIKQRNVSDKYAIRILLHILMVVVLPYVLMIFCMMFKL